jgi:2-methylcitrate dehydratase PrpD
MTVAGAGEDAIAVLVDHARRLRFEQLPASTVAAAKRALLDWLGAAQAGTSAAGIDAVLEVVRAGATPPQASVVGSGERFGLADAVFANAVIGRARELDDSHDTAQMHPGVMIHPVALALAEAEGPLSGRDLIASIVAAYDLAGRIGRAPTVGTAINGHSFHHAGAFGAVAVLGRHYQLPREAWLAAMGIAYVQVAGNQQGAAEGKMTVRMQTAFMARAGLIAGLFARAGVSGPVNVLEGRYGYYRLYHHDDYDRGRLVGGLGERFEIEHVHLKPYPTCMYGHAPIEAALAVAAEAELVGEEVERIVVTSNREHHNIMCEPLVEKRAPADSVAAQFSTPYAVAHALARGSVWLDALEPERVADPRLRALGAKVESVVEETRRGEDSRGDSPPARVRVELRDGSIREATVELGRGHPLRPMSFEDVAEKYRLCAAYARRPPAGEVVERTIARVASLERDADVGTLLQSTI